MGGELLVAKSWSSDPVYISYSVNYVYPTEIKGHFMMSLILPPVTISTTILALNDKLRCSSCSPFITATRGYKLYMSLCVCQCQKQWQRYSCGMQAVHVTFMKGDTMINSSGLLKVMSLSVPKIKTIALYYSPQAPKIPSWQDPLTPNPNHSTSSPWHKFLSAGSLTISTTALHFTHTRKATKCAWL